MVFWEIKLKNCTYVGKKLLVVFLLYVGKKTTIYYMKMKKKGKSIYYTKKNDIIITKKIFPALCVFF